MKTLLIIGLLSFPRMAAATTADSLYIVTYTTGTSWDTSKSPQDQNFFKEHSANLSKLRKEGVIKMGARYGEKGVIIIAAPSLENAKEIIYKDEAVIHKLFQADVQKLNVFYYGCLEKPESKN